MAKYLVSLEIKDKQEDYDYIDYNGNNKEALINKAKKKCEKIDKEGLEFIDLKVYEVEDDNLIEHYTLYASE